jgi:DNA-binding response OmpR family regulator
VNPLASILVVDDQPEILENLALVLEAEGYQALMASDGVEALELLQSQHVDLVLADIAMPRMNGYQLFERMRENPQWVAIPVLFLTARALDSDIRYGKQLGVDDYLIKPIEPEDLLAAVNGRLRRAEQLAKLVHHTDPAVTAKTQAVTLGRLRIDPAQHRVWLDGAPIKLSAREFTLLQCLALKANHVVSPQELIRATHQLEIDSIEAGTLLRPLIRSLRRKLGYSVSDPGCIENVRGVGYRLVSPKDR